MGSIISTIIAVVATAAAGLGSQACVLIYFDEPEVPASLIK